MYLYDNNSALIKFSGVKLTFAKTIKQGEKPTLHPNATSILSTSDT